MILYLLFGIMTRLLVGRSGVRIAAGARYDFLRNVQSVPGTHSSSYPVSCRVYFPGVKWPGREVDSSRPSSAEGKNECSYTSAPYMYAFMSWTVTYLPLTARLRMKQFK
jgi:hypothetical protein